MLLLLLACTANKDDSATVDSAMNGSTTVDSATNDSATDDSATDDTATDDSATDDTGSPPSACDTLPDGAPPLTILVVDEDGAPRGADRVRWLDAGGDSALWEDAMDATCADADCTTWTLDGMPDRIVVAADLRDPTLDADICIGWGAIATTVSASDQPQLVHLTLPTDALWCDDGATDIGPRNIGRFEVLGDDDCVRSDSAEGPLIVHVEEADGSPSSAVWVQWYWPPKSAEYDGDHDLACIDAGCSTWVGTDAPTSGDFYAAAMAYGPPPPDYLTGHMWTAYAAGPQVGAADLEITLTMEWALSAF